VTSSGGSGTVLRRRSLISRRSGRLPSGQDKLKRGQRTRAGTGEPRQRGCRRVDDPTGGLASDSDGARSSVLPLGAGHDVCAAVSPGQPLELEPDAQKSGVQANEVPAKPERFTLPQTTPEPVGSFEGR
jgi:hypothetical protein